MPNKVCKGCNHPKDQSEFYVKDKATGRRFAKCRTCMAEASRHKYAAGGEVAREQKVEYARQWRADNRSAYNAYKQKWRTENHDAEKTTATKSDAKRRANGKRKEYREAHKGAIKNRQAIYRVVRKGAIDAYNKVYREANRQLLKVRSREWRKKNPEADKAIRVRWKRANTAIVAAITHRRRARLAGCSEHFTAAEWEALKVAQDFICLCCGRREPEIKLTVDHVIPVSSPYTSNAITNIQGLCLTCNCSKNDTVKDYRPQTPSE